MSTAHLGSQSCTGSRLSKERNKKQLLAIDNNIMIKQHFSNRKAQGYSAPVGGLVGGATSLHPLTVIRERLEPRLLKHENFILKCYIQLTFRTSGGASSLVRQITVNVLSFTYQPCPSGLGEEGRGLVVVIHTAD